MGIVNGFTTFVAQVLGRGCGAFLSRSLARSDPAQVIRTAEYRVEQRPLCGGRLLTRADRCVHGKALLNLVWPF